MSEPFAAIERCINAWTGSSEVKREARAELEAARSAHTAGFAAGLEAAAGHYLKPAGALKYVCGCGVEFSWRVIDGVRIPEAWKEHIRSLLAAAIADCQKPASGRQE